MAVDPLEHRRAVGRFVTGVVLATTRTGDVHHGITANSFTSVSLDPVLVLVSVEKIARFHDEVLRSGLLALSVLGAGMEAVSRHFAVRGRPETPEQFARVAHHFGPDTGCVLLDDALATLECRVWSQADGGDHTLVVAEVCSLSVPHPEGRPLLYVDGRYRILD